MTTAIFSKVVIGNNFITDAHFTGALSPNKKAPGIIEKSTPERITLSIQALSNPVVIHKMVVCMDSECSASEVVGEMDSRGLDMRDKSCI